MSDASSQADQKYAISQSPAEHGFVQDPYGFYARRHHDGSAFFWRDYGHWCFVSWEAVNRLLRDRRFGRQVLHVASREELGWDPALAHTPHFDAVESHSLLSIEPPAHTRIRTLVNRAFVSRQIEQLRPRVEALSHASIDGFEPGKPVDLIAHYAAPLPVYIICEMLGVPRDMSSHVVGWSHDMVAMYMFGRSRSDEMRANEAAIAFSDYLRSLIGERRKAPRDDLITHMIETETKGQHLTDDELISTAILLLNAGHEATVHQTGNAAKAIIESGLDYGKLFSTPEQTAATIEECLRFCAPLHMFNRYALEDIDLGDDVILRKGDEVGLMLAAANHDPDRFDNPDTFNPFRINNANVSFGAGIHFCLGAPLARLELQTSLKVLFDRMPTLRMVEPPVFEDGYHFHGLERLMVSA